MNSVRIVVRVFAEVPDRASALTLAEAIKTRIAHIGTVGRVDAKQYWKIPEWFEASVELQPVGDTTTTFNAILGMLGEGWQSKQGSGDEQGAVWKYGAGRFFDPTVRWANVEMFPESAISSL